MTIAHVKPAAPAAQTISGLALPESVVSAGAELTPQTARAAIRTSLKASTLDGVFATVFSNVTGGVLLSNFLVELNAGAMELGLLAAIPMLVNLMQPLGAYLSDRTSSRHQYCLWIFGASRLLWLILAIAIGLSQWWEIGSSQLVLLTVAIVVLSHVLGALGSAAWVSWLAILVPPRLRGRYFGIRNSAASLTNLVSVPIAGVLISVWPGGALQGYGVVLMLAILSGILSLGFQYLMVDVNPQAQTLLFSGSNQPPSLRYRARQARSQSAPHPDSSNRAAESPDSAESPKSQPETPARWWTDANFLIFLLYFGLWMFSVNLSSPFFNLYMLDTLALDVGYVTLYASLFAAAHLLLLVAWGRLADRIGNRPILLLVGIVGAIAPLLWLGTGADTASVWLWLPLLHLLTGGTWAAIDLCINNLQLGVAPVQQQSTYFAIAAAITGVCGALGTVVGGFLAELTSYGGLLGLFALSSALRLVALLPLVFVQEPRGKSLHQILRGILPQPVQSLDTAIASAKNR